MPTITPAPLGQDRKDMVPAVINDGDLVFELAYITNHTHKTKVFKASELSEAESLGRKYCLATRTKFLNVHPFVCDLESEIENAIHNVS